jgi:epoxyqueuosine reductase
MRGSSQVNASEIRSVLEKNEIKSAIVSISRLQELKDHVQHFYELGSFNETFYQERLTHFNFQSSEILPNARSIIIATARQPIIRVTFEYRNRIYPVTIPPTYDGSADRTALRLLKNLLKPGGFHCAEIHLPEKLLLVFTGLAKYGKNNIAYVDGMGSFHRPVSFISDASLEETEWVPLAHHELCQKCRACIQYCPTDAISDEHFLIHAEKCLTYHNESSRPFPDWIQAEWHNCLIGCMICQNRCPLNKRFINQIQQIASFSEPETTEILNESRLENLSRSTVQKLKQTGLVDDYPLLGRNLKVLISSKD